MPTSTMLRWLLPFSSLALALLLQAPSDLYANYGCRPIDSLYSESDVVAVVKILGAETMKPGGVMCRAVVVRALRGCDSGQIIFFGPYIGKGVGSTYLTFLNRTHLRLNALMSSAVRRNNVGWPTRASVLTESAFEGDATFEVDTRLVDNRDLSPAEWASIPFAEFMPPSWIPVMATDTCLTINNAFLFHWVKLEPLLAHLDSAKGKIGLRDDSDPRFLSNSRDCDERLWSPDIRARVIYDLDSVPPNIRASADSVLRSRAGTNLMPHIHLMRVLVLDSIPRKRRSHIDTTNPPRYRFIYDYRDSSAGLGQYCIAVETDSGGRISQRVLLPNSSIDARKARLFPLRKAISTARRAGMKRWYSVSIDYSYKYDALTWTFGWYDEMFGRTVTNLVLNAHTGQRLEFSSEEDFSLW